MAEKRKNKALRMDPEAFQDVNPALMKALRIRLGFTVRQVAEKAKISTTTLIKMEAGKPVRLHTKMWVCFALGIMPDQVCDPKQPSEPDDLVCVVRGDDSPFRIAYTTEGAPRSLKHLTRVEDLSERSRLGRLGFVSGFFRLIQNRLGDTRFIVEILELSTHDGLKRLDGNVLVGQRHPGEEMIYCLQGPVTLTVGDQSVTLETGDSAFFDGENEHVYALGPDAQPGHLGRILSVCINPL